MAPACLAFVIISPVLPLGPPANISSTALQNLSIPSPVFADTSYNFMPWNASILITARSLSDLFKRITPLFAFLTCSITNMSSSVSSHDPSKTAITSWASEAASMALSTPIFSTLSSVLCMPAVSTRRSTVLPRRIFSSIVSLVVPAISVTMARS